MEIKALEEIRFLLATIVFFHVMILLGRLIGVLFNIKSLLVARKDIALSFKLDRMFVRGEYGELVSLAEGHLRHFPNDKKVIAVLVKATFQRREYQRCQELLDQYSRLEPIVRGEMADYMQSLQTMKHKPAAI